MNVEDLEKIFNETPEERAEAQRKYTAAKIQYAQETAVARSDKARLIAATEAWIDDPEMLAAAKADERLPKNVGKSATLIIESQIKKRKAEIEKTYAFLNGGPVLEPATNAKLDAFRAGMNGGNE